MEKEDLKDETMTRTIDPESFLNSTNAPYILDLFHQYRQSPENVSSEWQHFFQAMSLADAQIMLSDDQIPQWSNQRASWKTDGSAQGQGESVPTEMVHDSIRALMLIRAYRVRGHLMAKLDPLQLDQSSEHPELLPQTYGFTSQSLNNSVFLDQVLGLNQATVGQIYDRLKKIYCDTVGIEFMHIQDPEKKSWIQERAENTPVDARVDDKDRMMILASLIEADSFEHFLDVKYPGTKRFGLEGGESLIPALEIMIHRLAQHGSEKVVFGTAHRGRLNILANIIKMPYEEIFAHFKGAAIDPDSFHGSGDVKYHLGYSSTREFVGRDMSLTLMPNPSHLEAVDPVVLGKVRAEQDMREDFQRRQTIPVMLHGDAAFAGQGLVAETLGLSGLKGYYTGGAIHVIINNQIGFTTSPPLSRMTQYSSDIAKSIQAPIFHVNADDPEAVAWVMRFAVDYHRQFAVDVVVDLVCYRRHGHNEIDEPSFTQPRMYQKIAAHPSTCKLYSQQLVERGLLTEQNIQEMIKSFEQQLQGHLESLTDSRAKDLLHDSQWLEGYWKGIQAKSKKEGEPLTGASQKNLQLVAKNLTHIPEDKTLNNRLIRVIKAKEQLIKDDQYDWATAEALAVGSLLLEQKTVRLSGQDVSRGTFSHRHAVWVDQQTEERYIPLNTLSKKQRLYEVVDSPLAEASVLGFEYGYSLADPQALVMWEAQFGDFSNGAQVIIDQFISSGEHKWHRLNGLVMLLPHGYEGQGPEHSSARLERYLQLCAQNNMRVVNCTTPANYFHVLRRQLHDETRKPLIVMSPKSLLRHKLAISSLQDMIEGTSFLPVIDEIDLAAGKKADKDVPAIHANDVKRVLICSGKIYYELLTHRREHKKTDTAIIRLEQFYPFPEDHLKKILKQYKKAKFYWCQEEPMNMGGWLFVDRRLEAVLEKIGASSPRCMYVGRPEAASPATGNAYQHEKEQKAILKDAFKEI